MLAVMGPTRTEILGALTLVGVLAWVFNAVRQWMSAAAIGNVTLKLREDAAKDGIKLPDMKLVVGARLVFDDGTPDIIAYPTTRHGWGRLTRMLTIGNRRTTKGDCVMKLIKQKAKGEEIRKYGQIIGFATQDIEPGQHVHSQNLSVGDGLELLLEIELFRQIVCRHRLGLEYAAHRSLASLAT